MNRLKLSIVCVVVIIAGVLFIYGCDGSNPSKSNPNAPRFESTVTPENTATDQFPSLTISWSCIDPDSEEVKYNLYLGVKHDLKLIAEDLTESFYKVKSLEYGKLYRWKVIATDESGNMNTSQRYEFTTIDSPVYPLSVGNSWEYVGELRSHRDYYNTPDDSIILAMASMITISSREVIWDSNETYRFLENFSAHGITLQYESYFNNNEDGFYFYGSSNTTGPSMMPTSSKSDVIYNFKGQQFYSLRQLSYFIRNNIYENAEKSLHVISEDYPLKSLSYPLQVDAQWTFRQTDNPWQIDKRVIDSLNVTVPAGNFDSYQILWLYDMDEDQEWDDNVSITDYISFYGLVKREIRILGVTFTDYSGVPLGVSDYYENWELTNYNVK